MRKGEGREEAAAGITFNTKYFLRVSSKIFLAKSRFLTRKEHSVASGTEASDLIIVANVNSVMPAVEPIVKLAVIVIQRGRTPLGLLSE